MKLRISRAGLVVYLLFLASVVHSQTRSSPEPDPARAQLIYKTFVKHQNLGAILKSLKQEPSLPKDAQCSLEKAIRLYGSISVSVPDLNGHRLTVKGTTQTYTIEVLKRNVIINGQFIALAPDVPFLYRLAIIKTLPAVQSSKKLSAFFDFFLKSAFADTKTPGKNLDSAAVHAAAIQTIAVTEDQTVPDPLAPCRRSIRKQFENLEGPLLSQPSNLHLRGLHCQTAGKQQQTVAEVFDEASQKTIQVSDYRGDVQTLIKASLNGLSLEYTFFDELASGLNSEAPATSLEFRWSDPDTNQMAVWVVDSFGWGSANSQRQFYFVTPDRVAKRLGQLEGAPEQVALVRRSGNLALNSQRRPMSAPEQKLLEENGSAMARALRNLQFSYLAGVCSRCAQLPNFQEIFEQIRQEVARRRGTSPSSSQPTAE